MHKPYSWKTFSREDLKSFLHEALIMLALCVNYIFAHVLLYIWQIDFIYYLVTIVVASFLGGVVVINVTRSIFYTTSSLVVGGLIGIGITIAPLIMYQEDPIIIRALILYYSGDLAKILLFVMPLCIIVSVIGCFLREAIEG